MLFVCLATVVVASLVAAPLGRWVGRGAGWVLAAPLLGLAAVLATAFPDPDIAQSVPWMPTLDIELALRLDGLSLLFALLVVVIGAAVFGYASRYLPPGRQAGFYGLMTTFAAAMLLLVLADDVVLLFVAWEATTLCSFFLIARSGPTAREPAIRTLLVTAMGGLSLLAAVVVAAVRTGTTRLSEILDDPVWAENTGVTTAVVVLLVVAAFTKSAQFPFQAWLPDSMVAITPVSAYLHAAAMVKAGIYLLLRFSPAFADVVLWNVLLVAGGLITAVLGAVSALRRYDLKELLAYSTVSQLGLLVAMIGVGTREALTAAVVHTAAHALFKSALFMLVGVVDHEAGTRDIRELAAVRLRMPVTAAATVLAAVSMAGIPPLLGFVSKEGMFAAFLEAPGPWWVGAGVTTAAAVTAVLTFAYAARVVWGAFSPGRSGREVPEAAAAFWAAPAVCALGGIVLGVLPFLADPLVSSAATAAVGGEVEAHLALWHGVTPALGVSLVVLALGTVLAIARHRFEERLSGVDFPFSALAVVDALRAGTIRAGAAVGRWTGSTAPRLHLAIPAVCVAVIAVLGVSLGGFPALAGGTSQPQDWVLLVLIAAGVLAAVRARTRISAVVVTGVVGFTITLWFFNLGAADVALTQLLVEILTVCVMVLLLRRLPARFGTAPRRRRGVAALVAVGAGAATTLGVWAFTGHREKSAAAEYFLREGEGETGGANVVNTILVDFRALDTLGELTVLGIAGLAIAALLYSRRPLPVRAPDPPLDEASPLADARVNSVFARTLTRFVGPLTVLLSLVLLLRGHQSPGGGFIAALIGGAGLCLLYLSAPSDRLARVRGPYLALIGAGVVVAAVTGFLGYVDGSFLTPLHAYLFGTHLTTALVFDVGVYLAVIGVILAALNLLGLPGRDRPDAGSEETRSERTDRLHEVSN